MKGTIFNIQKFSVNDGPGIRTTVFMKGCPLRCLWCHNPESKLTKNELFYNPEKCISCGACVSVCPHGCHSISDGAHEFNRNNCTACSACTRVCPSSALEAIGRKVTVDEVIEEVMKDEAFYKNSNGGITLSGGEPMLQFDFAYALLEAAKKNNLHTCIETCGYSSAENYKKISTLCDIFLFDCKETDSARHKEYTGVSNELILDNLKLLDSLGCSIILRCPIIPGLNDREEHLSQIARLANTYKSIFEINLEPYHPLGSSKAGMLGVEYPLSGLGFLADEEVGRMIDFISKRTEIPVKKA